MRLHFRQKWPQRADFVRLRLGNLLPSRLPRGRPRRRRAGRPAGRPAGFPSGYPAGYRAPDSLSAPVAASKCGRQLLRATMRESVRHGASSTTPVAPMRAADFEQKWSAQLERFRQLDAHVSAASLCEEGLTDFRAMQIAETDELLTLRKAATESGYSVDHLSRLVRSGRLADRRTPGSHGRIVVRRSDLPHKPGTRHPTDADVHDLASRLFRGKEGRNGHP